MIQGPLLCQSVHLWDDTDATSGAWWWQTNMPLRECVISPGVRVPSVGRQSLNWNERSEGIELESGDILRGSFQPRGSVCRCATARLHLRLGRAPAEMFGKVSLRFASVTLRAFVLVNLISFPLPTVPLVCCCWTNKKEIDFCGKRLRMLIRIKPRKLCVLSALMMYFYQSVYSQQFNWRFISEKIFCHFDG